MPKATGTFTVEMKPQTGDTVFTAPAQFGRLQLQKTFQGDLNGQSLGEMISCRLADSASAGYVAMEQFTGTLAGQSGSFVLQHFGVMTSQSQRLILEVVPDSATEDLAGLSGSMTIDIRDGQHYYDFTYTF